MSAPTLLSVISPAVASVPQGPSGEVATGFQSLLAALSGEDAAAPGTRFGPAGASTPDEAKVESEAEAPGVASFLLAPTSLPTPLILPAVAEPTTGSGSDKSAEAAGESAASDPDSLGTTMPLPADKGLPSKTNEPQVQPAVTDSRPLRGPSPETRATLAQTAAIAASMEAEARTGAAPVPVPPPSQRPVPGPAPLRPLAERTSLPVEASAEKTGDGSRVATLVRPAAATVAGGASGAADRPTGSADFATAAAVRDAHVGEAEDPVSELASPVEGAAAQTQAAVGAREIVVSQLSRATIEATAQIAAQILRRLEGRSTRFEMALTPDELGRVDVKLDIDSEGRLNARLAFDNPAAATDLRGRADELRRQLEEAGFHLAEDAFEFADRDSGSSAFDRGQDARNGSSRAFSAASRLNTEVDVVQPPRWLALSLSPSGVDMKV